MTRYATIEQFQSYCEDICADWSVLQAVVATLVFAERFSVAFQHETILCKQFCEESWDLFQQGATPASWGRNWETRFDPFADKDDVPELTRAEQMCLSFIGYVIAMVVSGNPKVLPCAAAEEDIEFASITIFGHFEDEAWHDPRIREEIAWIDLLFNRVSNMILNSPSDITAIRSMAKEQTGTMRILLSDNG